MRLEKLDYPYSEDYKAGYIIHGSENRQMLVLIGNDGKHHCTAYARYLLATHLGRYLTEEETVDHINNDKTDDRLENLQILTREANKLKETLRKASTRQHGTYSKYRIDKCRCPACVAANSALQKAYRDRHHDELLARRRARAAAFRAAKTKMPT